MIPLSYLVIGIAYYYIEEFDKDNEGEDEYWQQLHAWTILYKNIRYDTLAPELSL